MKKRLARFVPLLLCLMAVVAALCFAAVSYGAESGYTVTFQVGEGATVDVYYTQAYEDDATVAADETNVTSALARSSDTGEVDTSGDGQVNFLVSTTSSCYTVTSVTATPSSSYKNLKDSTSTGIEGMYRLTKITGTATVVITTTASHTYEAAFEWTEADDGTYTATASLVCSVCGDTVAIDAADVVVTSETTTEATCTKDGVLTYTATFTYDGVEYTGTYEAAIEKIAHANAYYVLANEASTYASENDQTAKTRGTYVYYCPDCGKYYNNSTSTFSLSSINSKTNYSKAKKWYAYTPYTILFQAYVGAETQTVGTYCGISTTNPLPTTETYNETFDEAPETETPEGFTVPTNASNKYYFIDEDGTRTSSSYVAGNDATKVSYGWLEDDVYTYTIVPVYLVAEPELSVTQTVSVSNNLKNVLTVEVENESEYLTYTYQWYKDGEAIEGETGASLLVDDDDASYSVTVTATAGDDCIYYTLSTGTSASATYTVDHVHTAGEAVIENEVAATCTEDGSYEEVVYCASCGEELSRETVTVEATEHDYEWGYWGEWSLDEDGTPTVTAYVVCANCGDEQVAGETRYSITTVQTATCTQQEVLRYAAYVLPSTGGLKYNAVRYDVTGDYGDHSYEATETVEATCEEDGYTVYTCTVCGDTYTETLAATGHSWDEGEVTVEATATTDGVLIYACTVCGATYTEAIPATGEDDDSVEYEVIEGADQTLEAESGDDLVVTANGALADFVELQVDGAALESGVDYTVASGSTVATLSADYLATLEAGEHTLTFVYTDGECSTTFTLLASEAAEEDDDADDADAEDEAEDEAADDGDAEDDSDAEADAEEESDTDAEDDGAEEDATDAEEENDTVADDGDADATDAAAGNAAGNGAASGPTQASGQQLAKTGDDAFALAVGASIAAMTALAVGVYALRRRRVA